jgi:hypothetical protein
MNTLEPAWQMALEANFCTVQRWRESFLACAQAAKDASSVQLCFVPQMGTLTNRCVSSGAPGDATAVPLLRLANNAGLGAAIDNTD